MPFRLPGGVGGPAEQAHPACSKEKGAPRPGRVAAVNDCESPVQRAERNGNDAPAASMSRRDV